MCCARSCSIRGGNTHLDSDNLLYPVLISLFASPLYFIMKRRSVARSMLKFRDASCSAAPAVNVSAARFITSRATGARSVFRIYFRGILNPIRYNKRITT